MTLISFDVSGIGEGTVLSALLTFTGAGETGAPGGSVGVIYDYVARDGQAANDVPDGGSALNVHGVPSWFEAVEPGGLTAVDVTGSVSADGKITFVLPGQPDGTGSIYAMESGGGTVSACAAAMSRMQTPAAQACSAPVTRPSHHEVPRDLPRTGRSLPGGLRAFTHRDYRVFWFTQLVSLTGTWVQSLAQSWLVLTLTNSPAALGLIGVCQFGPTLILGLPAGVLVDRLPKRRLLLITQVAAAAIIGVLALLVITGRVQLWQIYVAAIALGVVSAVDMPARQAFVVDLVGSDDLMNAIALNSALFNTTRVAGPALAGLLLAAYGPEICFALNAVSYLPVIVGLGMMQTIGRPGRGGEEGSPGERLREGLAYVRGSPAVLMPIMLAGVMAIFGMNFGVWAPLLARDALHIGASGFGLLMSSLGVGSLIGALTLAFTGRRP
ncbi:MAG: hypothetical protein K0R44_2587, partial [Thermomicrobiales bacterium]|nr:hypothetical protein [Thermomicrobiales bacterium]